MKKLSTKKLVFIALFAAATTVATMLLKIPTIKGYFNLGEIMVYTAALTFGPVLGGLAGGLGSALADLYMGYFLPWAPITFILKGLEGYLVGRLGADKPLGRKIPAILIGGLAIIIGYPAVTALIYGWPAAIPEIYTAVLQVIVGGAVAIPLSATLKKIFKEEIEHEGW